MRLKGNEVVIQFRNVSLKKTSIICLTAEQILLLHSTGNQMSACKALQDQRENDFLQTKEVLFRHI